MLIFLRKLDHYDGKCDIWSLGVIFYQMVCGKPPFFPIKGTIENLISLIEQNEVQFASSVKVSEELKDLIRKMLERDAGKRAGYEEIWAHRWVQQNKGHVSQANTRELLKSLVEVPKAWSQEDEEQASWVHAQLEHRLGGMRGSKAVGPYG